MLLLTHSRTVRDGSLMHYFKLNVDLLRSGHKNFELEPEQGLSMPFASTSRIMRLPDRSGRGDWKRREARNATVCSYLDAMAVEEERRCSRVVGLETNMAGTVDCGSVRALYRHCDPTISTEGSRQHRESGQLQHLSARCVCGLRRFTHTRLSWRRLAAVAGFFCCPCGRDEVKSFP